jgi:hypothetical protein
MAEEIMSGSPTNAHEIAQTCYTMAYFVLPPYVHGQTEKVAQELSAGRVGAMFFYILTCKASGKEPEPEAVVAFQAHTGSLDTRHDYYVIQYPSLPTVDLSNVDADRMFEELGKIVLAPYFSAMVREKNGGAVRYFILGQSPGGGTTLRGVSPDINANLGPGCEPELEAFLQLLRERISSLATQSDEHPTLTKRWWQFWK